MSLRKESQRTNKTLQRSYVDGSLRSGDNIGPGGQELYAPRLTLDRQTTLRMTAHVKAAALLVWPVGLEDINICMHIYAYMCVCIGLKCVFKKLLYPCFGIGEN